MKGNKQDIYAFFPIWEEGKRDKVVREIADTINRNSVENHSNTPDFILAEHAVKALESFAATSCWREKRYGRNLEPNQEIVSRIDYDKAVAKIGRLQEFSAKMERCLDRPAAHHLIDIFKELKFGRPAASQQYLEKCIVEMTAQENLPINDVK